jgi:PAS domain S-box-containing protein
LARILVVDDHPGNRDLFVTLLRNHGHTVLEARDGAEGRLIALAQHPDLVITDLVMPGMDGYELVQELRAAPRLATTRVIFCTASFLLDEVRPVAAALGVSQIVPIPVEPESLLAAVDAALAAAPAPAPALPEVFHMKHLRLLSARLGDKVRELEDAEESLKESEARFRSLTESSPVGVFSLDRQGQITYSNPRLLEICGLSEGQAAVRSWTDLLHPEDRGRVLAGWAVAAEAGARYRDRVRIVPPGGGLRWTDIQAAPVLGGSSQLTYVGTVVDVTETLEAQEQRDELQTQLYAQRAEARFLALLEAAPDAMVCVDRDGQIMLVNAQTERLFGYGREELAGQAVEILLPGAIKTSHPARRAECLADPRPRPMGAGLDLVGRRRDGSTFPAEVSLSTIDAHEGILVMAAVRDGSERLELQAERDRLKAEAERDRLQGQLQQSQRLESLGQLAGGVAHDFNNLLAVITSYAAFVADEIDRNVPQDVRPAMRDDIQQIEQAAERAAGLTHQLLAFARREVIELRPLNLNDVVASVEQLLVRTLGGQVELTTDLATDLHPVLADPGQMEQVLVNLAVNARDAMPAGGKLTIQTATTEVDADQAASRVGVSPGRYTSLKVSDTGTGMPQDVIDRAFEPFYTTKAKDEGTGLGLSTVYGIVTQAGGHVSIHSEPGLGTTFTILLPATSQVAAEAPPPPRALQRGDGETVLVVEDEAAVREVIRRILARNGYQVITAANGRDAVEVAASHPGSIDVLVTAVVMPQMPGKEAAEQIRARYPAVKVLFMSGYTAGALDSAGVLEADVNLIEKPFTEASLLARLREVISALS